MPTPQTLIYVQFPLKAILRVSKDLSPFTNQAFFTLLPAVKLNFGTVVL